jgi:hypothetical protein
MAIASLIGIRADDRAKTGEIALGLARIIHGAARVLGSLPHPGQAA